MAFTVEAWETVADEDEVKAVITHPRFVRMDIRDLRRHVVVIVDEDGGERSIAGAPRLVWLKAREELVAADTRDRRDTTLRRRLRGLR